MSILLKIANTGDSYYFRAIVSDGWMNVGYAHVCEDSGHPKARLENDISHTSPSCLPLQILNLLAGTFGVSL